MMIPQLLDEGYLRSIGDDDTRLGHVEATASELGEFINKKLEYLPTLVQIALEPQVDPEDPVIGLVEEKLKKHWPTYKNKFRSESPVLLLRAVILECLAIAVRKNDLAAVIWMCAATPVRTKNLKNELVFLTNFVRSVGEQVEATAARQWSYFRDSKPLIEAIDGSRNGDSPEAGVNIKAISTAVAGLWSADTSTFETGKSSAVATAIETEIGNAFDAAVKMTMTPIEAIKKLLSTEILLNKLIWWKQSKYSETLQKGYREVDVQALPLVLALDLSRMIPDIHPQSVEYFLREAIADLGLEGQVPLITTVQVSVEAIAASVALQNALPGSQGSAELRKSLIGILAGAIEGGKVKAAEIKKNLGVDPNLEMSPADFCVWCFQDVQAQRIVQRLTGKKRK